jgi:diguanylate cyclase (GGDEF)-like protein
MQELSPKMTLCPLGAQDCPICDKARQLQEECDRLQELVHTDHLTGFFNRRHLMKALDQEMERTRRTGLPTSLIMLDLDYFKKINDTYGHHAGDEALRWSTGLWRASLRRIDIPCRYGGEEFAIILPGTRLNTAVRVARRLQDMLQNSPLVIQGQEVTLTVSLGVAAYKPQEELTVRAFIKRADHYLLEAKIKGRNQVCYQRAEPDKETAEVSVDERSALFGKAAASIPIPKKRTSRKD